MIFIRFLGSLSFSFYHIPDEKDLKGSKANSATYSRDSLRSHRSNHNDATNSAAKNSIARGNKDEGKNTRQRTESRAKPDVLCKFGLQPGHSSKSICNICCKKYVFPRLLIVIVFSLILSERSFIDSCMPLSTLIVVEHNQLLGAKKFFQVLSLLFTRFLLLFYNTISFCPFTFYPSFFPLPFLPSSLPFFPLPSVHFSLLPS